MAPFEDDAPQLAATVILLLVLGCIVLPLRVWVRAKNNALGLDDHLMIVAAVPWAALSVVCIGGAFNGVGVHQSKLDDEQTETALLWFWLFEVFWCIASIPVKLSIAFMLARIAGVKRAYVLSLYAVSALVAVMSLIALFYIIFRCSPVSAAWSLDHMVDQCQPAADLASVYYVTTAVNILTDWFCALLPIPLLRDVPMNFKSKLTVSFLLGLGALASISACVRLKYTVALNTSQDTIYGYGNLVLWGYAEVGIGFFVGSLSTLRPLFSKILRLGGSSRNRHGGHEGYEIPAREQKSMKRLGSSEEVLTRDGIHVRRDVEQHRSTFY